MRNWSARNKFSFIAIITLAIGSIFILTQTTASQTSSSETDPSLCPSMTNKLSKSNSLRFHPLKIVAEPWRGEHNVYAIFAIPLQSKIVAIVLNYWSKAPTLLGMSRLLMNVYMD
jgi:hypothetical protein